MLFVQFIKTLTVNIKEYSGNYATFATLHNCLMRMRTPTNTIYRQIHAFLSVPPCTALAPGVLTVTVGSATLSTNTEVRLAHYILYWSRMGYSLPQLSVQSARRIVK